MQAGAQVYTYFPQHILEGSGIPKSLPFCVHDLHSKNVSSLSLCFIIRLNTVIAPFREVIGSWVPKTIPKSGNAYIPYIKWHHSCM